MHQFREQRKCRREKEQDAKEVLLYRNHQERSGKETGVPLPFGAPVPELNDSDTGTASFVESGDFWWGYGSRCHYFFVSLHRQFAINSSLNCRYPVCDGSSHLLCDTRRHPCPANLFSEIS